MPSFHCERTSSHEYKWNSTSCPEGVPRKKKGISTAKAAVAIEISGAHLSLLRRALPETLRRTSLEPGSVPDFMFAASFVPPASPRSRCFVSRTCSHKGKTGARSLSEEFQHFSQEAGRLSPTCI